MHGAGFALLHLIEWLTEKKNKITVVLPDKGPLSEKLEEMGISCLYIRLYMAIYPPLNNMRDAFLFVPRFCRTLLFNLIAASKINHFILMQRPDIIHTNVGTVHLGYNVAKKNKIPHVWHIREYQVLDFYMHPLFSINGFIKKLNANQNYPIAITYGINKYFSMCDRSIVVYDGVMAANQSSFSLEKEDYFLFVGRLEEAKGIRILIRAFIEFCRWNVDFTLRIAGSGTNQYLKELHQQVEDANITSRVQFLGFRNDVHYLMSKATALIVPSRFEGFGFITAEAMFNGCLVIGNNTGGTREILEEENLGILYSSQGELAEVLKQVVTKGIESYYPMMKKALEKAVALYSKEQNAMEVYRYYQRILNDRK